MSEPDRTRQRVLEAAGPIFAQKGFDGANVREITKIAGTSPASVNYHFRNKEELYIETVRHAAESCNRLSPVPVFDPAMPAEKRLREFIHAFLGRFLREDVPAWHRLLIFREVADPRPGACERFVKEFVKPTFGALQQIVRDLTPRDTPPETINLLGGSIVGQCLHYHHARHIIPLLIGDGEARTLDRDALTDHIWRFSLAAIRSLYPIDKGDRK